MHRNHPAIWRNWSSGWGESAGAPWIAASTPCLPDVDVPGKRHQQNCIAIADAIAMIRADEGLDIHRRAR